MSEYHFMGGDNKEYGPYSVDQIRRLMAENRLNANTNVRTTGGGWKPASTYPELGFASGPTSAPMPGQPQLALNNPHAAQQMVNGPAIFMMVLAIIGIGTDIFSLGMNLLGSGMGAAAGSSSGGMSDQETMELIVNFIASAGGAVVNIVLHGLILFGSIKMKNLESYGLAMTAAILSTMCCNCCVIGMGAGIWSLVVLNNPQVRAAFRAQSHSG